MTPAHNNILFLDIETVPAKQIMGNEDSPLNQLWKEKVEKMRSYGSGPSPDATEEEVAQEAGLYAEFGQVICISFGTYYISKGTNETKFCVTSCYGDNEHDVLAGFANMLTQRRLEFGTLCGHNAKEFDIPFMARRMVINRIPLPEQLKIYDKKPWEIPVIDTMEMWKFGAYRYATQLKLLCEVLGIPSPKDDIDGSEVASVYYKEKDLDRIASYCEKDVIATMQIHRRLTGEDILDPSKIEHVKTEPCMLDGMQP